MGQAADGAASPGLPGLALACNYTYITIMMDDALLTPGEMNRQCRCLRAQRQARLLARAYDAAFRPLGITSGQFSILAALNQPEPVPLTMLAQVLGLERTTLTRNLRALEAAGFVSSGTETDQRVRALRLTGPGLAKLRAAMPLWRRAQANPDGA